jgi:adenylate kinase family enzyme
LLNSFVHKRILILGDAGRGKSTFAQKLSEKTNIATCSTDDFYWKKKFTEKNDRELSISEIQQVYAREQWIVDGTSSHLIQGGLMRADIIFILRFTHIIPQYYFLITRYFRRSHESLGDLWALLKHVTYKRYKKGYGIHKLSIDELVNPHLKKVVNFTSMRQINKYLNLL